MKRISTISLLLGLLLVCTIVRAQQSSNSVKFKVTYDAATQIYTTYVIPNYSVPNANNNLTTEKGATAQFTLVVPKDFLISNITDINGTWDKNTLKLGPGQPQQNWSGFPALDPNLNYYVIGKAPNETDYGTFAVGQPVPLFSFRGNGCFGVVYPLPANDPFINAADQYLSLNVGNSFYSRSGQPAGGNQNPLEQFETLMGPPADCRPPVVLVANPDNATVTVGAVSTIAVLGNDINTGSPASTSNVTVSILTPPANGTATINANGTISFTPAVGFVGQSCFQYQICDVTSTTACANAQVCVTVRPQTTVTASPDAATITAGTVGTVAVLGNDTNTGGPASITNVTVSIATPSPNGTAVVNPNGTISFTPNPGFTGLACYTYQICDLTSTTVCSQAQVCLTVNPQTAVTANPDAATITAGTVSTLAVLGNDTNTGRPASITNVTVSVTQQSTNGTAVVNPDGTISFTPTAGYTGTTCYTYQICDIISGTVCATTQACITVRPQTTVTAAPDAATITTGAVSTIAVLGNDTNTGGPASTTNVTVSIATPSPNGTAVVNPNGTISFTPAVGFIGQACYTYQICDITSTTVCSQAQVCVTVRPQTTVVANPDATTITTGTVATVAVLGNDTNTGGPASTTNVTVSIVAQSPNGTAVVNPNGTISFTPNAGYTGQACYTYGICDITSTSVCSTAQVCVTVNPQTAVTANPDAATITAGTVSTLAVLGNDTNTGRPASTTNVTVSVTQQSANGTAVVNPDGTISFTPNAGYAGTTCYTYQICDIISGTVCATTQACITVRPQTTVMANPDAATITAGTVGTVAVLGNDTNTGGPASITNVTVSIATPSPNGTAIVNANGTISFTPNPGFTGLACITYQICDLTSTTVCSQAQVCLTVNPQTAVVANPDAATITAGTVSTLAVLGNDTNTGRPASITNVTVSVTQQSTNGTAVVNADGTISFTPTAGYTGTTCYTYQICDIISGTVCATTQACITVRPQTTVMANPDAATITAGTVSTVAVLGNDTNTGGPASTTNVTVSIATPSPNGTAVVNANGTISFTPNPGFTGQACYTYQICDITSTSVCSQAQVCVTVNPQTAVVANPDAATITAGTVSTLAVLGNDTNTGRPASITNVTVSVTQQSTNGTAVVNPDGTISFTPNAGYAGTTCYTYQICDIISGTVCATTQACITVNPQITVTAAPDNATITTGTVSTIAVLGNDTNTGRPASITNVTVSIATPSPNGTAVVNPDGTISFTPAIGFIGQACYTYQICDITSTSVCTTAQVCVTVRPQTTVVANPDATTITTGTVATVAVLGNDTNTGGPASTTNVTVSITTPSPNGTAVVNANGTISFTPAVGFIGQACYTYQICDITSTSICSQAQVCVTVNPQTAVTANPDAVTITAGTVSTLAVLGNDTNTGRPASITNVTVSVTQQSPNGTAVVNADGTITFTPNAGYAGTACYTYRICDIVSGTVCATTQACVTVTPLATVIANPDSGTATAGSPVTINIFANDNNTGAPVSSTNVTVSLLTPPANGTATLTADGRILYRSAAGFSGIDCFTYQICDIQSMSACSSAQVCVTVAAAPVPVVVIANPDSGTTTSGTEVITRVLANDTNTGRPASSTNVIVSLPTPPANGTAVVNLDGTISFTPATSFTGVTCYTYQICDITSTSVCTTAQVCITVLPKPPGNADIRVTKVLAGNKIRAINDVVTYTIVVKNLGADRATNVVVKDSLGSGLQFVSGSTTVGSFASSMLTIPALAAGDSAILTVNARLLVEGIAFNYARLVSLDQVDPNSTNNSDQSCVSVPVNVCTGEAVVATIPALYTNVTWYKDGVQVGSGNAITLVAAGTYTFSASNSTCPAGGCCPLVVVEQNCCPANVCVPFVITKTRRR